jgi:hypothetical protein
MDKVHEELVRHVVPCRPHVEYKAEPTLMHYCMQGTRMWSHMMLCGGLKPAPRPDFFHSRKMTERALIERSMYPLFAMQERSPTEVAWIIVIAAHWTW